MNIEFWGLGMSAYGYFVTPDEMAAAWSKWDMRLGYRALGARLVDEQAALCEGSGQTAAARVADRMCQKARKAGLIKPIRDKGRQGWSYTDEGREALHERYGKRG